MAQDNESKLQGEFSSPVETSSESHSAKLEAPTTTADHNATATTTTSSTTTTTMLSTKSNKEQKRHYQALDSFSWSEEPNFVKIYVDFENAHHLNDEQIKFVHTIDSLELIVTENTDGKDKAYLFEIDALFDRIESATLKKKKNKFIITMKKLKERIWYKIRFD